MSFAELLTVLIVGLIIVGPDRLPQAIKSGLIWFSRVKRMLHETRSEFESQLGMDEIRREIHNEQVMASLKALEEAKKKLKESGQEIENSIHSNGESNSILPPQNSALQEPSAQDKENEEPSAQNKEPSAENKEPSALAEEEGPSVEASTPAKRRVIEENFEDDEHLFGEQLGNHPERKKTSDSEEDDISQPQTPQTPKPSQTNKSKNQV